MVVGELRGFNGMAMTDKVRELLEGPEIIGRKISRVDSEIRGLRDALTSTGSQLGKERVQSSPEDNMSRTFAEICDKEDEKNKLQEEKIQAIKRIYDASNLLQDDRESTVIIGLYVGKKRAIEIAKEINYSERTIFDFRSKAIKHLEPIAERIM